MAEEHFASPHDDSHSQELPLGHATELHGSGETTPTRGFSVSGLLASLRRLFSRKQGKNTDILPPAAAERPGQEEDHTEKDKPVQE